MAEVMSPKARRLCLGQSRRMRNILIDAMRRRFTG
jgi:hypothetical protein